MINCAEECILLCNYTYLVSVIMAIHIVSSRDPRIFVSINCILLLLVVELIVTEMHPCNFSLLMLHFNFANSPLLMPYSVVCSRCSFIKDSMMFLEFWYSVLVISPKITIPIPPSFTGKDSSFLQTLLGICLSIRAGIKTFSTY